MNESSRDCGTYRDDSNLGGQANVGEEEASEQRSEGALPEPHADGVEEELVAAVSILLPASQFVVDCKRDTLLETLAGPSSKTDNVTSALKTERHVKVFRDVALGPELLIVVLVKVADLLDSTPAENGIMTNKGCHVAVGNSISNSRVDEVGEECDAVLEVGVHNLHDTR